MRMFRPSLLTPRCGLWAPPPLLLLRSILLDGDQIGVEQEPNWRSILGAADWMGLIGASGKHCKPQEKGVENTEQGNQGRAD